VSRPGSRDRSARSARAPSSHLVRVTGIRAQTAVGTRRGRFAGNEVQPEGLHTAIHCCGWSDSEAVLSNPEITGCDEVIGRWPTGGLEPIRARRRLFRSVPPDTRFSRDDRPCSSSISAYVAHCTESRQSERSVGGDVNFFQYDSAAVEIPSRRRAAIGGTRDERDSGSVFLFVCA
jgi:hypothetical protein